MPTDEGYPMITTAPVALHDLNRVLKRDSQTCNNDICESPAICVGPISNYATCCYPGESCSVATTCYPYTENQTYIESVGASYCTDSAWPNCNTYVFDAYNELEVIYCNDVTTPGDIIIVTDTYYWGGSFSTPGSPTITQYVTVVSSMSSLAPQTSTAPSTLKSTTSSTSTSTSAILAIATSSSAVATTHHALLTGIVIGIAVGATLLVVSLLTIFILLWRRRSSSSITNIPQPSLNTNPEIQVASYVSPNKDSNPHTSWTSVARGSEKSPSCAFEARRTGSKPEGQVDGVVDGICERPACVPPVAEMVAPVEPIVISELGGESRGEMEMAGE
ncbi:uncharacterized protein EAF01_007207 [Botrytis porri]|uniref:Mid2 domain-containing protein n=1 Tax=Botrytis porri TaxID=87229 RepID=A0A4Z1KSV9_9HELO|nr:uncharacterized protein EAF01_007207 [Botrytis porri]KAF7901909.1 hypothetical protein EAF01_007207 [Botrytis porri]TGO86509.1 hypothetical protein BPOR_0298g00120 [Botrytis porri]